MRDAIGTHELKNLPPPILVEGSAGTYRGPLLVGVGFFTGFFLIVVVDLGMVCDVVDVTPGT